MKKNIILILSLSLMAFLCLKLTITKTKPTTNLIKVNSSLSYKETSSLKGYSLKEDNVYYLTEDYHNYNLYKITDNTNILLKSFNTPLNCSLKTDIITCKSDTNTIIYNYNFHELLNSKNTTTTIPYKDTYLKVNAKTLNILINNQDQIYRNLPSLYENYIFKDYLKTKTNTFLLYQSNNTYFLYNVNTKNDEKIIASSYYSFASGFIFNTQDTLKIYNLETNDITEISYSLDSNDILTYNENILYVYNKNTYNLKIYDIKTSAFLETNLNLKDIITIFYTNNKLYLLTSTKIHVIYLNNIDFEEQNDSLSLLTKIKKDYNINIKTKEDAILNYPDFTAEKITNDDIIDVALSKINTILPKFTLDFFNNFYKDNFKGLNIYLTGTLTPMDTTTQISNPAAYSFTYNNEYIIVIDINQYNVEELFCHELMHNIELNLHNSKITSFPKWSNLNPQDFHYNESYTKEPIFDYTLKDATDSAYFIDTYSHSYDLEDRARIFENICAYTSDTIINDYPHILKKGLYLKEEITKYYPSLKVTNLFNYLDNNE